MSRSTEPPRSLVAIGNFDGVHRGHQAVLQQAAEVGAARGLQPIALTFDPHPASVLGRAAPPMLTRLERKVELIRAIPSSSATSIEVHVERFDHALASKSPLEFATWLRDGPIAAAHVLVGQNFRFGKDRQGDFAKLEELGRSLGFDTSSHPLHGDARGTWSSTRVRAALAAGEVAGARVDLGRPHMISGLVVEGAKLGRTIGFPTANLGGVAEALPRLGVYAVLVDRRETSGAKESERFRALARGVANLGVRPTVDDAGVVRVEAHLFELDADLYGAELRVHFVGRIRDEQRFSGIDALRAQIARDAADARAATAVFEVPVDAAFF